MIRTVPIAALAALACAAAPQQPAESPDFEAVSVKLVPMVMNQSVSMWMKGGPGTGDPTRIDFHNASLNNLIARAYGVADWQLSGPDWIRTQHYDIVGKVPPGTTKEQFNQMLAKLLADRFGFRSHRETKEGPLYSLRVAKGGPKLRPHVDISASAEADRPAGSTSGRQQADAEGFPILTGKNGGAGFGNKHASRWNNVEVSRVTSMVEFELRAPVHDDTGVAGKFDIDLHWVSQNYWVNGVPQDTGDGPDIFAALRGQLGLDLQKSKGPVETLVIDHIEQTPTPD